MTKLKRLPVGICLLFLLTGCQEATLKDQKGKMQFDQEYTKVCEGGNLNAFDYDTEKYGMNLLPVGYYGNYPDSGIVEIGGKAGDVNGKNIPPMDFKVSRSSATINFSVVFESNPYDFPSSSMMMELGYECSVLKADGTTEDIVKLERVNRFSELFASPISGWAHCDSTGRCHTTIVTTDNILNMSVNVFQGEKINYVRFHYGAVPQTYTNVAAFIENGTIGFVNCAKKKYEGNDCTRYDYTKKIGSHQEYNLISQYGSRFSKNYLLSCFLVKDEQDNLQDHVTEIYDPDDYFHTGDIAHVGSKFDLTISVENSAGRKGSIVLHLTVKDKMGPLIYMKEAKEKITSSYKQSFDAGFIDEYFDIQDNYDEECDVSILDADGNALLMNKIGTFQAKIVAKDSSDNKSEYPFFLELIDDVAPVIETTQSELTIPSDKIMTTDRLLNLFTCEDEIDGRITPMVEVNTYTNSYDKPGEYEFTISATDKSGNKATSTIKIFVVEPNAPVFFVKESFLTFTKGNIPSEKEIIQSLIRENILEDKNYTSSNLVDGEEISNRLGVGKHYATMQYFADDGTSQIVDLTIEVISDDDTGLQDAIKDGMDSDGTSSGETSLNWWQRFCNWWKKLWESIVSFFTGKK